MESVIQVPLERNPESSTRNPESIDWNPESKPIVLDYLEKRGSSFWMKSLKVLKKSDPDFFSEMRTFVVVGCLVACFVAVESRALSTLESNTAQVAQVAQSFTADQIASAPQQFSFQGQSDELKQDKGKKGMRMLTYAISFS